MFLEILNKNQLIIEILYSLIILTSLLIVATKIKVYKVMFLILAYINTAILAIYFGYEYVGVLLIVVYAGAIIVLIIFIVMILGKNVEQELNKINLVIYFITSIFLLKIIKNFSKNENAGFLLKQHDINIFNIAELLYTSHSLMFLNCGIILFLAMLGSIYIIKKI